MPTSRKNNKPAARCRVTLQNWTPKLTPPVIRRLKTQAAQLARHAKLPRGVVAIAIADDRMMSKLHVEYTGVRGTTDVLTFDLRDNPADPRALLEADIIICLNEATRQAKTRGHTVEHELLLYIVHGMLHLVGHDDHDPDAAAVMHRREDEILAKIGIGPIYRS